MNENRYIPCLGPENGSETRPSLTNFFVYKEKDGFNISKVTQPGEGGGGIIEARRKNMFREASTKQALINIYFATTHKIIKFRNKKCRTGKIIFI